MLLERIPIRLRLSLIHACWMGALFAGVGFGIFRLVENHLFASVDTALITSAQSIRDARFLRGFSSPLMQQFLDAIMDEKNIRPYAQLIDFSGRVSAKTTNVHGGLPVTPLAVSRAEKGLYTTETFKIKDQAPLRQVTLPVIAGGKFTGELVQVGASLSSTYNTLNGIGLMLWTALPAGLLLSIFFGYHLTRRSLQPVAELRVAAEKLSADDLRVRLPLPRARDELRELTQTFNDMLDRLDDAFGRVRRFAGDVSHELRTPLSVLKAEAELALRRERTPREYQDALRSVVKEATHMTAIVEDLLLLARAQSNAVHLHWEPVGCSEFAASLVASVHAQAEAKQVEVTYNNRGVSVIEISRNYLELAIRNLLLNAIKHSRSGQSVVLQTEHCGGDIVISVIDQGEGIPAESLPYIFDAFYRVDSARNRALGGTGIGLSLTQAMVKLHGGRVDVVSNVGQGSTFRIVLPNRVRSDRIASAKVVLPVEAPIKRLLPEASGVPAAQPVS